MISGFGLTKYFRGENTFMVAADAISSITGVIVERSDIANSHRHGRDKKMIFAE